MKHSAFLKVTAIFLLVYSVSCTLFFIWDLYSFYDKIAAKNISVAGNYSKMGRVLLKEENIDDLSTRLDEAIQIREIHYYQIRKSGQELVFSSTAGSDDPIIIDDSEVEGRYEGKQQNEHYIAKEGDYVLVVGFKNSLWNVIKIFFENIGTSLIREFVVFTLFATATVLYSFRDLREVLRRLKQRGANRADATIAKSSEMLTLVQGLRGYQESATTLANENAMLRKQVLPSLQHELWSGQAPPYEFDCTLVRTDINNFSTLFGTVDRNQFMEIVNEFFVGVAHIASRYTGFVHEFIGDEVLFYFKDQHHLNSAAAALSAARDVNELAESFNARTERDFGYSFHIKTSLASGTLRFGPLVNGYSLAGTPLIETVRMLTHVHEKSENTILFDDNVRDRVGDLCVSRELGIVMLKGIAKARRLHVYQSYVPVIHHLRQMDVEHIPALSNYRSNADVSVVLGFIQEKYDDLSQEFVQKVLSVFRDYNITDSAPEIKQSYLNLLDFLLSKRKEKSGDDIQTVDRVIATTVSCAPHFFNQQNFTSRVRDKLMECLVVNDRRTIANLVDTFSALDPSAGDSLMENLLELSDNRVEANSLILHAKRDFDRKTKRRLGKMLKTQSAYYKASGLYALGEIAKFLKATDEVAYYADLDVQKLITESISFAAHANKMVRRQAIGLASKTGRLEELQNVLKSNLSEDTKSEIAAALSAHEKSPQAARHLKVS